jgi:hypothetical protein
MHSSFRIAAHTTNLKLVLISLIVAIAVAAIATSAHQFKLGSIQSASIQIQTKA